MYTTLFYTRAKIWLVVVILQVFQNW
jgi:hypothetical protein